MNSHPGSHHKKNMARVACAVLLALSVLSSCTLILSPEWLGISHVAGTEVSGILWINEAALRSAADMESDWVELYNSGDLPISLEGFCLSDDPADPGKWSFPAATVINAHSWLVILLNGKNQGLEAGFKLSANDAVYLYAPDGASLIDQSPTLSAGAPATHQRSPDGGSVWIISSTSTPGKMNQ